MMKDPMVDVPEHSFAGREHREMSKAVDRMHETACMVGSVSADELTRAVQHTLDWASGSLEPHMGWEESWLFPEIDRIADTPWATRMLRFEHQQIRQRTNRLRADQRLLHHEPDHHQVLELRCQLFGLEAVIRAHLEREEAVLFPLLDGER